MEGEVLLPPLPFLMDFTRILRIPAVKSAKKQFSFVKLKLLHKNYIGGDVHAAANDL